MRFDFCDFQIKKKKKGRELKTTNERYLLETGVATIQKVNWWETHTGKEILLVDKVKEKRFHICHRKGKVKDVTSASAEWREGQVKSASRII